VGIQKRQVGNKTLWGFVLGKGIQERPMAHLGHPSERH